MEKEEYRAFLKSPWGKETDIISDQQKGKRFPLLEKPSPIDAKPVNLVPPDELTIGNGPLIDLIASRKSRREYSEEPLSLEELSFLLWATQGVHQIVRDGYCSIRTVPSAGARHPFETYLVINRVDSVEPGVYRYLAFSHRLCRLSGLPSATELEDACAGQEWVTQAAVVFVWAAVPYRTEWRYTMVKSPKVIALDAGHVCQNLYLACEAIDAGTCAVGAYDQEKMDALIGVDGEEEFTVYIAPVGRIRSQ